MGFWYFKSREEASDGNCDGLLEGVWVELGVAYKGMLVWDMGMGKLHLIHVQTAHLILKTGRRRVK